MDIRKLIKRALLVITMVIVSPVIVVVRLGKLGGSESLYSMFATGFSLLPGLPGNIVRLAYYKGTLKSISSDVKIGFGSFISRSTASIGKNVSIGAYCILGNVCIGNNVNIASRVSMPSGRHQHSSSDGKESEANLFEVVSIGSDTWIGEGAIVIADVGCSCIIGSGSVVPKQIPDNSVAVGNPAKVIKSNT